MPSKKPKKDSGLRGDMSQFYTFKMMVERILGPADYKDIKESGDFPSLQRVANRLLTALELSLHETVQVSDQSWRDEIDEVLTDGKRLLLLADDAATLFSILATTLTRLSFLQVGLIPRYSAQRRQSLRPGGNALTHFRSVQYVQNSEQIERLRRSKQGAGS